MVKLVRVCMYAYMHVGLCMIEWINEWTYGWIYMCVWRNEYTSLYSVYWDVKNILITINLQRSAAICDH
jgi:hypothetical protein